MSKKLRTLVLLALFLVPILIIKPNSSSAVGSLDQSCMIVEGDSASFTLQVNREESSYLNQRFTPSNDRLTGAKLFVNGDGKGQVYTEVYKGRSLVARSNFQNEPSGWGVITFNFPETAITPGDTYKLAPRLVPGNGSLLWYIKIGDCYTNGGAYFGNNSLEIPQDFGFATYGYNTPGGTDGTTPGTPATPSADNQDQSQSAEAANLSLGLKGEEPREPSNDIEPPQNLSATAKVDSNILIWKASPTLGIDGYRIFRSENQDSGFKSIGEVSGDVIKFTDSNIEKGKTYFYFVRATMGEKESKSSNTVKAEYKEKGTAESKEDNSLMTLFNSMPLWKKILTVLGIVALLALFGYLVYEAIKYTKNKRSKHA